MTMHSSLRSGRSKKGHRSVLKRFERLSILMEKEKWNENQSVFGLAKVKTLKVKIKREKAPEAEVPATAEAAVTAAPAAGTKQAAAGTPAAPLAATAKKPEIKKEEKKK